MSTIRVSTPDKSLSTGDSVSTIRVSSTEGDVFEMDVHVASLSVTLKDMLEALGIDEQDEAEVIKLPKLSSRVLKLVIDWGSHHVNDKPKENEEDERDDIPLRTDPIEGWDLEFLQPLDTCDLFELIMAANYLHIKGLLALSSKAVANLIKGKSPEEIREIFNLPPMARSNVDDDNESDSD